MTEMMAEATTPSTLKVYLVERLREAILSGKYKPGDRLNESLIAREFEISRIPVREALFQLQESGLVMNHKRRGMFVTLLSEEDTQKINSVRLVLETEAFRLARARMTPEVAATLTALVNDMEAWNGTLSEATALDLKFHQTIWAASGNPYLLKMLEGLTTVLFAYKTLEHASHELRRWRLSHHRALLDVLLGPTEQDPQGVLLMHLRMAYNVPERFASLAKQSLNPQLHTEPQRKTRAKKPIVHLTKNKK
jgi:DNA-binding GntR family transcriptional regulator